MYDLIIIGAGPAGVSACVYATSRGLKVLVIEKNAVGGIIGGVSTVSHYTAITQNETGATFAKRMEEQLLGSGATLTIEEVISVDFENNTKKVTTTKGVYQAKAIIIANGSTAKKLEADGAEKFRGKTFAVNASKTAEKYRGRNMYVIGGADGAVKEALYLSKFAKQVTIVCVEEELACIQEFCDKVKSTSNIVVRPHSSLTSVKGNEEIEQLVFTDIKTKETEQISDDGAVVYTYIGLIPNTQMYDCLHTDNGYLIVNNDMETSISGVFAVGDICKKAVRQVSTAVSDGTIAGINAFKYLNK